MAVGWGTKTNSTQLTSITTEQFFSQTPQLDANQECHVTVDVDFPATPTDNAVVSVYGSLDGTNWDDTPLHQFQISRNTDPNQVTFVIGGVYQFRVGVKRSGTTDTITSADMSHRIATLS